VAGGAFEAAPALRPTPAPSGVVAAPDAERRSCPVLTGEDRRSAHHRRAAAPADSVLSVVLFSPREPLSRSRRHCAQQFARAGCDRQARLAARSLHPLHGRKILPAPVAAGRVTVVKTAEFLIWARIRSGEGGEAGDPTKLGRIASSDA
jgi:hypothetical protein